MKKVKWLIGISMLYMILTACANSAENLSEDAPPNVVSTSISSTEAPPTASANSSPITKEDLSEKVDDSIRAIGTQEDGQLVVKPVASATVAPLGAPSCYGQESDFRWSGEFEVVWESKTTGKSTHVMKLPIEFEIIQPDDSPVEMQKFQFEETEIFAYVPRYTDCHSLETYLFGISNGEAFPISFEMKPDQILAYIGQLPNKLPQVMVEEFIVIGGYGAGQDFIDVYHFRYDPKKRSMILESTEQAKPNDVIRVQPKG